MSPPGVTTETGPVKTLCITFKQNASLTIPSNPELIATLKEGLTVNRIEQRTAVYIGVTASGHHVMFDYDDVLMITEG